MGGPSVRHFVRHPEQSLFFVGKTLARLLTKSAYGTFWRIILERGLDGGRFNRPVIIVIGQESAGKSSLLELLLKCEMFPRDVSACTRAPIRFILVHATDELIMVVFRGVSTRLARKEDVLGHLQGVMDSLVDEQGNPTITDEEVVVTLHSPEVPDFELVDLPGIREFPENLAKLSKALSLKYITSPYSLIVCVIPAPNPRLTSSQALGMVIDNEKQANTILALTMADRVQPKSLEQLLLSRVTGVSNEIAELKGLAGCVAVINRSEQDESSLQEAEVEEARLFDEVIAYMVDVGLDDRYPVDKVASAVTSGNLMRMLDGLFRRFISDNWKPRALEDLARQSQEAAQELLRLGTPVDQLDWFHLVRVVMQQAHIDMLRSFDGASFQDKMLAFHADVEYKPVSDRFPVDNELYRMHKAVDRYTGSGAAPAHAPFIRDIQAAMAAGLLQAFRDDLGADMAKMLPSRFENLLGMVKEKLAQEIEKEAGDINRIVRDVAARVLLENVPGSAPEGSGGFMAAVAERSVQQVGRQLAMVAQRLFADVEESPVHAAATGGAVLHLKEEFTEWQRRRRESEAKAADIEKCMNTISNIHKYMEQQGNSP
eukprot:jgi/Mesvir1/16981/Mv12238-RA.1